jgi:hypothetical protein
MSEISRILTILTLIAAAYGIALPVIPLAIRTIAPPVRHFEVTQATRLADGRVRLMAQVEKRHCIFTALRFAWRGEGAQVWRVGYTTADQPEGADPDRPAGHQSLGPWIIAASPTTAAQNLHIDVRHRCGPFAVITPLARIDATTLSPGP